MTDIAQSINAAIDKMLSKNAIAEMIEKHLEKTVNDVIKDALSSYSPFGKALTEGINQGLAVDFSRLSLQRYHEFILQVIRRQVDSMLMEQVGVQITDRLQQIIQPAPAEIKLTELIADFITWQAERRHTFEDENISFHGEFTDYGSVLIYFDAKDGLDKHRCGYQLHLSKDDLRIIGIKIHQVDPRQGIFIGPHYQFERKLFGLYAGTSKIILDVPFDEVETAYPERHCEC